VRVSLQRQKFYFSLYDVVTSKKRKRKRDEL